MIKISKTVEDIIENDDLVKELASQGLLNSMAYARKIKSKVEKKVYKEVKIGSITAAINRYLIKLKPITLPPEEDIKQIIVQKNLAGLTYERTKEISDIISKVYKELDISNKEYLTLTQGLNEITIIGEIEYISKFKDSLINFRPIYDINNIVGITVKFGLKYMNTPNLFYLLIRKLALKNINIIEIVSTATELTFIIDKKDLGVSLEQLQKEL